MARGDSFPPVLPSMVKYLFSCGSALHIAGVRVETYVTTCMLFVLIVLGEREDASYPFIQEIVHIIKTSAPGTVFCQSIKYKVMSRNY